jgi:hypothetical protein
MSDAYGRGLACCCPWREVDAKVIARHVEGKYQRLEVFRLDQGGVEA